MSRLNSHAGSKRSSGCDQPVRRQHDCKRIVGEWRAGGHAAAARVPGFGAPMTTIPPGTRYFLIAGNTRVGSTWLQTSFQMIPDTMCGREIRWKMAYQASMNFHTYIDQSTSSMKERIEKACVGRQFKNKGTIVSLGAKLKFDPYGYVPPEYFRKLSRLVEDDITVIYLTRPYFEIFQSWRAFGIRHLMNPEVRENRYADSGMNANFSVANDFPLVKSVIRITKNGVRLDAEPSGADNDIDFPISSAIEELFVLFYNDIMAFQALRHVANFIPVDYRDIGKMTPNLAKAIGTESPQEVIDEVFSKPMTSKMEQEGEVLVSPVDPLRSISNCLDRAFGDFAAGRLQLADIVQYQDEPRAVIFSNIPGLDRLWAEVDVLKGMAQIQHPQEPWPRSLFARRKPARWVSAQAVY